MSHNVLIAEGDATELELIATVLARDGFHVVRAVDGPTAVSLFDAEQVELVICAAELPEMDGAAVCERLKGRKPETRVVLLHAAGGDIDASAILLSRIGCDAVLPSPFRYDALKNVLADWGMRAQPKAVAIPMSFAVPAPDITTLVAAPSLEGLVPEAAAPALEVLAPVAAEVPIAVPIPIPVVLPAVTELPVLTEHVGNGEKPQAPEAIATSAAVEADATIAAPVSAPPSLERAEFVVATQAELDLSLAAAFPEPAPEFNAAVALRMLDLPVEPHSSIADDKAIAQLAPPVESTPSVEPPPAAELAPPVESTPSVEPPPAAELAPPLKSEPSAQPSTIAFGAISAQDAASLPKPRQGPPPPPVESIVDPNQQGSGVRAGASSWAPSSSVASGSDAPRIEARGLIASPPTPDDNAVPPPPPLDALAGTSSPGAAPPHVDALAGTTAPPLPREALYEPPTAPLAPMASRPLAPKHEPRTTLPPSVPPEGDLRSLPLPRLLFELYGGTYCGTLKLMRKGVERTIDVWNGFPVAASVTPAGDEDSLAALLRDHGRITPEQYTDAKRRAPGREAQLLVALGVIDERDLLDAIREQTELRVISSFEWRDGHYKITAAKDPHESVLSEVHPIKAIWRGCSEYYDVGSLLTFFSTLRARYIVATEVFPIHYSTLGPFLRRVGIADILNGHTTFEQALRSDDTQALAIAQALYVLIVTDMVRAQSHPGVPVVLPENKPQRRQTKPVDYRELSKACEEVARTYLGIRERDYFEMLEVSRDAGDDEVNAAYERLSKPFKVEILMPGLPDDVMRRAREIDGLLRRARDTLVSPEERRRYLTRIDA